MLVVHVAATWAMVGLIWFVQIVHYPLFSSVGAAQFVAYEAPHTRRTSWTVALFMPIEAVTAVWLVVDPPPGVGTEIAVAGLVLVVALWVSTAAWQAPLHRKLSRGYDAALQQRLVRTNWARTGLWTVRGALVLAMVGQALA